MPMPVASAGRHRQRGDRDVGVAVDVRLSSSRVVHPVEVIAGQDQVVVGVVLDEMPRALRTASAVP